MTETRTVTETVLTRVDLELGDAKAEVLPRLEGFDYGDQTVEIDIVPEESVTARGLLPDWASQRTEGGDIFMRFGFAGSIEVESDEVKVRQSFLGWENFWFDTYSPYWGESFPRLPA